MSMLSSAAVATAKGSAPSTLGARVQELRREKRWTQAQLAAKAGIDVKSVSRIESGATKRVTKSNAASLAAALGVTVNDLGPSAKETVRDLQRGISDDVRKITDEKRLAAVAKIVSKLASLPDDERDAAIAALELMAKRRAKGKP